MRWRWDQGRLDYFQLDEIENIARALTELNGSPLPKRDEPDTLRSVLAKFSDRPFRPIDENYKVWRNYKRVFGCQMLATEINGSLVCTELCKKVASHALNGDDYLLHIARHFAYPSPVFDDYDATAHPAWPVCALVKFLIAGYIDGKRSSVSMDDIIDQVLGNRCDGTEPLASYAGLPSSGYTIPSSDDSYRQLRELVRFISQFSFLKWDKPDLILDVSSTEEAQAIAERFVPRVLARMFEPASELLQIGGDGFETFPEVQSPESKFNPFDLEFTEGNRARALHLKIERSMKLRELYFARAPSPSVCDMCKLDTLDHYPWTNRLIELHHLLPLSSPIRVEKDSTSLKDIVGLCPTCHRATHKFYASSLDENGLQEFRSVKDAMATYELAKNQFIP